MVLCDWLLSLSVMFSSFVHVAVCFTYTLPCVKQIPCRTFLYNAGNSTWGSVMTQRGGKRACWGREVQDGGGRMYSNG